MKKILCSFLQKAQESLNCSQLDLETVNSLFPLSNEELIERLRIDAEKDSEGESLINCLYDIALARFDNEFQRKNDLDNKAFSMVQVVGVTFSISMVFCGLAIGELSSHHYTVHGMTPVGWLLSIVAAPFLAYLLSILYAVSAARITEYREMSQVDAFNAEMLNAGVFPFKRYMITHMWTVYIENFHINERKAVKIKRSQVLFLASIVLMVPSLVYTFLTLA